MGFGRLLGVFGIAAIAVTLTIGVILTGTTPRADTVSVDQNWVVLDRQITGGVLPRVTLVMEEARGERIFVFTFESGTGSALSVALVGDHVLSSCKRGLRGGMYEGGCTFQLVKK